MIGASGRSLFLALAGAALAAGCARVPESPSAAVPKGGSTPVASAEPTHLTLAEARALAAQKQTPLLVDFYSPT